MMRTVHLLIEGRVQGVGFRAFVEREAVGRGLTGWVRNLRTGAVETMFSGSPEAIEAMIEACGRGPSASRVAAVYRVSDVEDGSAGTFQSFEVRPTV